MFSYGVVLIERPLDEGLSRVETIALFDMLHGTYGIPIEIVAQHSSAMGFINVEDADLMNYDYSALEELVTSVLNDMENEREDCHYILTTKQGDIDIFLTR